MKYSKQRELIRKMVMENTHPTAEDVYYILKKDNPKLSLGTVYRNLNILVENGDINKIAIPNACDHYDGVMDTHYHIICDECRYIFDVEIPMFKNLNDDVSKKTGIKIKSHEFIIHGICRNCQD